MSKGERGSSGRGQGEGKTPEIKKVVSAEQKLERVLEKFTLHRQKLVDLLVDFDASISGSLYLLEKGEIKKGDYAIMTSFFNDVCIKLDTILAALENLPTMFNGGTGELQEKARRVVQILDNSMEIVDVNSENLTRLLSAGDNNKIDEGFVLIIEKAHEASKKILDLGSKINLTYIALGGQPQEKTNMNPANA